MEDDCGQAAVRCSESGVRRPRMDSDWRLKVLEEDKTKDWGVAHTRGGSPHKKQLWGPHSRKNWAAPVEAWSASINLPWEATT